MEIRIKVMFAFILLVALTISAFAGQNQAAQAKVVKIVLKDGSELVGTIESEDAVSLKFRTLSNVEMVITRDQIESIEGQASLRRGGKFISIDPNSTRLFFAPTARPLKSGQGYFADYELFFPYFAIGVTDFLALGGGMTLFPGAEYQLYYLAPKISPLRLDKFSLAGGVLFMGATSSAWDFGNFGIVYGVGTYGSRSQGLTVGVGWGFSGEEIANNPILLLGGEIQLSNNVKLLTENWIIFGGRYSPVSFGIRFFGKNLAADIGLIYPADLETHGFPFIPWLGFAYNFGSPKK
jgi:hypothetical protein